MFQCLTISLNVSTSYIYIFYDRKPKQQLLDVFFYYYFIFEYQSLFFFHKASCVLFFIYFLKTSIEIDARFKRRGF